ncbi:MAG: hypothetical protein K8H88_10815, partial [Sandaracinaceae bacterium]|nr:hypothetical protein [Sandaracinaceae bacterium]
GLTLAELRTVASQLVDSLCSIYHSRIRYPWQEKKDGSLPLPGAATEEDVARARETMDGLDDEPSPTPETPQPDRPEAP